MTSFLTSFMHKNCKIEMLKLIQAGLDNQKIVDSLNIQIINFINQIQELKTINDFQTSTLEKKVIDLEKKLAELVANKIKKDEAHG